MTYADENAIKNASRENLNGDCVGYPKSRTNPDIVAKNVIHAATITIMALVINTVLGMPNTFLEYALAP